MQRRPVSMFTATVQGLLCGGGVGGVSLPRAFLLLADRCAGVSTRATTNIWNTYTSQSSSNIWCEQRNDFAPKRGLSTPITVIKGMNVDRGSYWTRRVCRYPCNANSAETPCGKAKTGGHETFASGVWDFSRRLVECVTPHFSSDSHPASR